MSVCLSDLPSPRMPVPLLSAVGPLVCIEPSASTFPDSRPPVCLLVSLLRCMIYAVALNAAEAMVEILSDMLSSSKNNVLSWQHTATLHQYASCNLCPSLPESTTWERLIYGAQGWEPQGILLHFESGASLLLSFWSGSIRQAQVTD